MPKSGDGYLVSKVVYADDVLRKWNIDSAELNSFIESFDLVPFLLHSIRENPETGENLFFIKESRKGFSSILPIDMIGNIDTSKVVFMPDQIEKTEKKHPHLALISVAGQPLKVNEMEEKLVSAYLDVEKWAGKASSAFSRIVELEDQLAQTRQENERLTQEIASLKAGGNGDGASIPRTTKAVAVRAEKTAEKWAAHLERAVSLALECKIDNKSRSGKEHASMWKVRFGEPPAREALRAMRRGLPDDMVKGER